MNTKSPHEAGANRRRLAQTNLKRCPLCDSLNARSNQECFVCRWHGSFDHDADRIEASLISLIDQCPEYLEERPEPKPGPGLWKRLQAHFRRHIDLQA